MLLRRQKEEQHQECNKTAVAIPKVLWSNFGKVRQLNKNCRRRSTD